MHYKNWLASPAGKGFIELERLHVAPIIPIIFGYHALLIGAAEYAPSLEASRIKHKIGVEGGQRLGTRSTVLSPLFSRKDKLAIETNVIDLVYLAHCLEFSKNQHEILREVYRVLRPDGRVVITMFNPLSLGGVWLQYKWKANFISLIKLKDWLALLGFDIIRVNHFHMAYVVEAVKRVIPLTPLKPAWAVSEKIVSDDLTEPTT